MESFPRTSNGGPPVQEASCCPVWSSDMMDMSSRTLERGSLSTTAVSWPGFDYRHINSLHLMTVSRGQWPTREWPTRDWPRVNGLVREWPLSEWPRGEWPNA
jgi:hypothetical protein